MNECNIAFRFVSEPGDRNGQSCWQTQKKNTYCSTRTLLLQSWFWRRLCPPTRLCDGGTEGGCWFWLRLRWVLIWTRSVSQALAPWGGASPASPLAGEGGPTKALGGNDRPGPDTTGAPLPLPIRAPVSTFFGHDCIGHGQPWKAAVETSSVRKRRLSSSVYTSTGRGTFVTFDLDIRLDYQGGAVCSASWSKFTRDQVAQDKLSFRRRVKRVEK